MHLFAKYFLIYWPASGQLDRTVPGCFGTAGIVCAHLDMSDLLNALWKRTASPVKVYI